MTSRSARLGTLALLALLGYTACNDGGTEPAPTPSRLEAVNAGPFTGIVGEPLADDLVVRVVTADSAPVPGATVRWEVNLGGGTLSATSSTTDDQGLAVVTWTLGTRTGTQQVEASVQGVAPLYLNATAVPGPAASLSLGTDSAVFDALLDTLSVSVSAEDQYGNALADTSISVTSSDDAVALWLADGRLVSVGNGTAIIIAAADDRADTLDVVVAQRLAAVPVSPDSATILAGDAVRFSASAIDPNDQPMEPMPTITWSSDDDAVATIDADGLVTGVAPGLATLTATADTVTGTATVVVLSADAPVINSIAPDTLVPGDTATLTGLNFSASPGGNAVTIAGVAGTVLTATTTQLTVELPARGDLPCQPTAPATVSVEVNGLTGTMDHPLTVGIRHTLGVGESYRALDQEDVRCHEIASDGAYLIGVFNTSRTAGSVSAFELRGDAAGVAGDPVLATARSAARPSAGPRPPMPDDDWQSAEGHLAVLEMSRRIVERLGRPARLLATQSVGTAANTAEVGDTLHFRVPDIDADNACNAFVSVSGRVAYLGTRIVIVEDLDGPLAGTMDATYDAVGAEFDTLQFDVLNDNFGNPLVADDQLDDNDRLIALFSPAVNDFERGVAGFVFSGDFYPNLDCASSDGAEIFYGRIATDQDGGNNDPDSWRWRMRSTIIHEAKHLTAYAHKIPAGGNLEEAWLEEATARLSEELWARQVFGYGPGGNVTFDESLYCERRPVGFAGCEDSPYAMYKHFGGLYDYLESVEDFTPLRSPTDSVAAFYGAAWSLVRWAIDHSGLDEASLVQSIVQEQDLTGVENLEDKTGLGFVGMVTDWGMAWAVDDRGLALDRPELTQPGWDIRDIFAGMNGELPGPFPEPYPLLPRQVTFGDWLETVASLRAGTGSFFELTGSPSGPQLIELQGDSGTETPATLRIAIVRTQ